MQPKFLNRFIHDKQSLGAVAAGLLACVGLTVLASGIYQDLPLARATPATGVTAHTISTSASAIPSVEVLLQAEFFGTDAYSSTAHQVHSAEVPETRLRLQLQGVMGSTGEDARVLIAQEGQRAKYYRLKDTLPGGASIRTIEASQVILNRNGMLETLKFPKPQTGTDTAAYAAEESETDASAADGSPSQFQQLHESQVADQVAVPPSSSEAPPDAPPQTTLSIKERLQQLRESRNL